MKKIFPVLLLACLAVPAFASKPGAVMPMRSQETQVAEVFITRIGVHLGALSGVEWVWIPPFLVEQCQGKSLKECREIDYQNYVRIETDADGNKRMVDLKRPNDEPYRVTSNWIANPSSPPAQMAQLAAMPFIQSVVASVPPQETGHEVPQTISRAHVLHLKIEIRKYDNGTNYSVAEILP